MTGLLDSLEGALRESSRWVAGVTAEVGSGSWPAGVLVAAVGLLVLVGGARARRPVAILGSAGLAALAVQVLAARGIAAPGVAGLAVPVVAAAAAAAIALPIPQLFPALAGALPAGLLADLLAPQGYRLETVALGAGLGILVGFLAARLVAAAAASSAGALAFAIGGTGALRGTGVGRALSAHPTAILAVAILLAVTGTAFQYAGAWGRGGKAGRGGRPDAGRAGLLRGPDGKPA